MRTGAGLALICVGAILAFAVTANTSVFNVHTAGWVLMIIGLIGLFMPRRAYGWLGQRVTVRRTRFWPGNRQVDEVVPVSPYVARNPGTSRMEAGLPPAPTLTGTVQPNTGQAPVAGEDRWVVTTQPEETEVVEDLYEQ